MSLMSQPSSISFKLREGKKLPFLRAEKLGVDGTPALGGGRREQGRGWGKVLMNCCTPWLSSIKYTYYVYRYIHVGIAGHIPASSTSPWIKETGRSQGMGSQELHGHTPDTVWSTT